MSEHHSRPQPHLQILLLRPFTSPPAFRVRAIQQQKPFVSRVGQNHIYIRCIYGILGRGITKYTVIYGGYTRLWPTLHIPCHTIRGLYPQSIRKQVNASRFVGAAAMVPLACVRKRSWHRDQVSNANDFPHPT